MLGGRVVGKQVNLVKRKRKRKLDYRSVARSNHRVEVVIEI